MNISHPTHIIMGREGEASTYSDEFTTVVWAQVKSGEPLMRIDEEECLRPKNWPQRTASLYLGDVADVLLRIMGPHEPAVVTSPPGFDEQTWCIEARHEALSIKIESKPYWGFGLTPFCFLNKIEVHGSLSRRSRLFLDLVATLGRQPWKAIRKRKWEKVTQSIIKKHETVWKKMIEQGKNDLTADIDEHSAKLESLKSQLIESKVGEDIQNRMKDLLTSAETDIEAAKMALEESNSSAVERALGRVTGYLHEASPDGEFAESRLLGGEAEEDYVEEKVIPVNEISLEERVVVHSILPEDRQDSFSKTEEVSVEADWLLFEEEEMIDSIPFVDLSNQSDEEE